MGLLDGIVKGVSGLFKSVPILGNIVSEVQDEYDAERNFEKQEDLMYDIMAKQNQYNIDAFNRENAYNTPLAQRQRAVQAGINPNWSDGNAVAASQTSTTQAAGAPDISTILNSVNQAKQTKINESMSAKQKEVMDSEIDANMSTVSYNHQKEDESFADTQKKLEEAEGQRIENQNKQRKIDTDIATLEEAIEKSKQERAKLANDIEYQNAIKEPYIQDLIAHAKALEAQGKKDEAEALYQRQILPYMKKKLSSESYKAYAEGHKAESEVGVAWYNAVTGRMELNETSRHNLVMEKFESDRVAMEQALNDVEIEFKRAGGRHENAKAYYQELENELRTYLYDHGYKDMAYKELNYALWKLHGEMRSAVARGEIDENNAKVWLVDKLQDVLSGNLSTVVQTLK